LSPTCSELARKLPLFGLIEDVTMIELVPALKARIYLPEEMVFMAGAASPRARRKSCR
jgi:hypothetical protein